MARPGLALAALAAAALGAAACRDAVRDGDDRPTSLRVTLRAPADLGDPTRTIADRALLFDVEALGRSGQPLPGVTADLNAYVFFSGTLTPAHAGAVAPLALVPLVDGRATGVALQVPVAFGPSVLWLEDTGADRESGSFATGTSPILYYPNPLLSDVQRPADLAAPEATFQSPLENKQVILDHASPGGKLLVTAVYNQAFTVTDTGACPATNDCFNHLFVFTFSRPGEGLRAGHVLAQVSGQISEFNGFTEVGFPQFELTDADGDGAADEDAAALAGLAIPEVRLADLDDLPRLEALEAGVVSVAGGTVCPLDDNFTRFSQWKLDVGAGCEFDAFNVISAGQVSGFDPARAVGHTLPRVTGTLRNVSGRSAGSGNPFNIWILNPRDASDLVCDVPDCAF